MKGHRNAADLIPGLEGQTLGDFWSWALGDLLQNTTRPMFAEWLVGTLLGVESRGRVEWDAYDLAWRGERIEVKSSAFLQSWPQRRPSAIRYDIAKKRAWDAKTNTSADAPARAATIFVFCLYTEREDKAADPARLEAWEFFVVSTALLNERHPNAKSLGLGALRRLASPVAASDLLAAVKATSRQNSA